MKDVTVSDLSGVGRGMPQAGGLSAVTAVPPGGPDGRVHRYDQPPQFISMGARWEAPLDPTLPIKLKSIEPAQLGTWIETLLHGNVAANRHNSPDLGAQLGQALRRPIDTVLCAVLDVDPSACLNSALAARHPVELVAGVLLVARVANCREPCIIVDYRVPSDWFTLLRQTGEAVGVRVESIINDYPQADPTVLLYTMLGRRLRPMRLPTEQGAVVLDAAAAVAVGRCALLEQPMSESPIVVRDHGLDRSQYVTAPIGTTIGSVIARLVLPTRDRILRAGDLLRDQRVPMDTPVSAGELVFHSCEPVAPSNPFPCIRCGWCVDSCPTRVHPATVLEASQRDDADLAEHAGIEACIECGICSYVCPSNLPLLDGIRRMKRMTEG